MIGACSLLAASAVASAPPRTSASSPQEGPLARLEHFVRRLTRSGELPTRVLDDLGRLVPEATAEVQRDEPGDATLDSRLWSCLLDIGSYQLHGLPEAAHFRAFEGPAAVRRVGRNALLECIDAPGGDALLEYLIGEVLLHPAAESYARRALALHLVDERRTPSARLALTSLARFENDPLRPDVLSLLPSWPGEAIDLYLVGLLGKKYDPGTRPHPFTLMLERIRDHPAPLAPRATALLAERLGAMMIDRDWREASRGLELARGIDARERVPLLLDALTSWHRRAQRGGGNRRIQADIVRELRRVSGRSAGSDPRNWISWWVAVRQGKTPLHVEEAQDGEERTSGGFFGLRPESDRVVFVIDLSGSMDLEWGTSGHTRYIEAIDQMMRFLQAGGESVYFDVVLFNSQAVRARGELVPATTRNLESARNSLLRRTPENGTYLRPAIELALGVDGYTGGEEAKDGGPDTIVVLCDGSTAEGSEWVRPFLDRIRAEVRVQFHCVLLSGNGDGSLRALAEETGGDYLQVGG